MAAGDPGYRPLTLHEVSDDDLLKILRRTEGSKPCYFEDQKRLSKEIVDRIRFLLQKYHGKALEEFTDFDYQIYTSRSRTLENQTRHRLELERSGCVPPEIVKLSAKERRAYTRRRVDQYSIISKEAVMRHKELCREAEQNPNKLFLIIADEAHWGITGNPSDDPDDSVKGARERYIDTWSSTEHKNVLVMLVSATPYNLMTEETLLPLDKWCARNVETGDLIEVVPQHHEDGNTQEILQDNQGKDVTSLVGPKQRIHHVRWTEIMTSKLEKVIDAEEDEDYRVRLVMKSLVNNKCTEESYEPVYLVPQKNCSSEIVPLVGVANISDCEDDATLILESDRGRVRIFKDVSRGDDEEWLLIVKWIQGRPVLDVGFMKQDNIGKDDIICDFEMSMEFGENVFALLPIFPRCDVKLSLFYDDTSKRVQAHAKPKSWQRGTYSVLTGLPAKDLFFMHKVESRKIEEQIENITRYLSLNFYYSTMWNRNLHDRLIRHDQSFENLCVAMAKPLRENEAKGDIQVQAQDDILIAEYCIFIVCLITINELKIPDNEEEITSQFLGHIQQCAKKINDRLEELKDDLPETGLDNSTISPSAFIEVLKYHRQSHTSSELQSRDVWDKLLEACLFGNVKTVEELVNQLGKFESEEQVSPTLLRKKIQALIDNNETARIVQDLITWHGDRTGGKMKVIRVRKKDRQRNLDFGTRWYTTLTLARDVASGDKMYLFDVLKDFGNSSKLSDIYKKNDSQKHKTLLVIQQNKCRHPDKSGWGECECDRYWPQQKSGADVEKPNAKCGDCKHHHNKVEKLEDLNRLPCILIIVEKGKMGDTFPESFSCLDLRVRCPERIRVSDSSDKADLVLSTIVQGLGRLCRYSKETDLKRLPYALVSRDYTEQLKRIVTKDLNGTITDQGEGNVTEQLEGTVTEQDEGIVTDQVDGVDDDNKLHGCGTIYSSFIISGKLDLYTSRGKKGHGKKETTKSTTFPLNATLKSAYSKLNSSKESQASNCQREESASTVDRRETNRILLDAEPQCGKTGTFCHVISQLMKTIMGIKDADEDESGTESDSDDSSEEEESPTQPQTNTDEEVKWQYPYWKDMESRKMNLAISRKNKYNRIFGHWIPGQKIQAPAKYPLETKRKKVNRKPGGCSSGPYQAFSYSHNCPKCRTDCTSSVFEDLYLEKQEAFERIGPFKVSIPNFNRYSYLRKKIPQSDEYCEPMNHESADDHSTSYGNDLQSWIFAPSSGRAKSGCFNLYHTMRGPRSENEPIEVTKSYIQIIVVKPQEFDEYHLAWGTKMAILQLPATMKNDENDEVTCSDGGIGFSRRFIQRFALEHNLSTIFMLDDNVHCVSEAQFTNGAVSRQAESCEVKFKRVPLFKVLKHLENQFDDDTLAPVASGQFEPYKDNIPYYLESYTGSHSKYALTGIRKSRGAPSKKVKNIFAKVHVFSLVLLNVEAVEGSALYQPVPAREDVDFNYKCHENGHWVVKFNRFLLSKKRMPSSHTVFVWDGSAELKCDSMHKNGKVLEEPLQELDHLKAWIEELELLPLAKHITGSDVCETNQTMTISSPPFQLYCRIAVMRSASTQFILLNPSQDVSSLAGLRDALKHYLRTTEGIGGFKRHIIAVSAELCRELSLIRVENFRKLCEGCFEDGFQIRVITSHKVEEFKVTVILIAIAGTIISPMDTDKLWHPDKENEKRRILPKTAVPGTSVQNEDVSDEPGYSTSEEGDAENSYANAEISQTNISPDHQDQQSQQSEAVTKSESGSQVEQSLTQTPKEIRSSTTRTDFDEYALPLLAQSHGKEAIENRETVPVPQQQLETSEDGQVNTSTGPGMQGHQQDTKHVIVPKKNIKTKNRLTKSSKRPERPVVTATVQANRRKQKVRAVPDEASIDGNKRRIQNANVREVDEEENMEEDMPMDDPQHNPTPAEEQGHQSTSQVNTEIKLGEQDRDFQEELKDFIIKMCRRKKRFNQKLHIHGTINIVADDSTAYIVNLSQTVHNPDVEDGASNRSVAVGEQSKSQQTNTQQSQQPKTKRSQNANQSQLTNAQQSRNTKQSQLSNTKKSLVKQQSQLPIPQNSLVAKQALNPCTQHSPIAKQLPDTQQSLVAKQPQSPKDNAMDGQTGIPKIQKENLPESRQQQIPQIKNKRKSTQPLDPMKPTKVLKKQIPPPNSRPSSSVKPPVNTTNETGPEMSSLSQTTPHNVSSSPRERSCNAGVKTASSTATSVRPWRQQSSPPNVDPKISSSPQGRSPTIENTAGNSGISSSQGHIPPSTPPNVGNTMSNSQQGTSSKVAAANSSTSKFIRWTPPPIQPYVAPPMLSGFNQKKSSENHGDSTTPCSTPLGGENQTGVSRRIPKRLTYSETQEKETVTLPRHTNTTVPGPTSDDPTPNIATNVGDEETDTSDDELPSMLRECGEDQRPPVNDESPRPSTSGAIENEPIPSGSTSREQDGTKMPHQCFECAKGYQTEDSLTRHLNTVHILPNKLKKGLKQSKQSKQTLETDQSENSTTFSGMRPSSKYKCSHCDRTFPKKGDFKRHMDKKHSLSCPSCEEPHLTKEKLREHMEDAHPSVPVFYCSRCSRCFLSAKSMNGHERSCAVQTLLFCEMCPKSFRRKGNLENHMRKVHGSVNANESHETTRTN